MKPVITGSNGFIGSMLRNKLVAEGADVRCLVRSHPGSQTRSEGYTSFGINYADEDSLVSSGALNDATHVFHVAGVTKALTLNGFRQGNVLPTRNLINALQRVNPGLQRFILISSQAAAGPAASTQNPKTEAESPVPAEDYGLSKLEAEQLLTQASLPFPYTIIRPAAVYGPRDVDFLALFKQLKNGLGIYPGNRKSYVSTIYVDDLVNGILDAAQHSQATDKTYFLTNEVAVSWEQIYKHIADIWSSRLFEINLPIGIIAAVAKLGDLYSKVTGKVTVLNSKKIDLARPKYWVCSSEQAAHDFGFKPQMALAAGLKETFDWYK
ncbi:MAG: NAD-dependent epimerase/dehydratase family protein, partial [Bacteroidota bacterium]